MECRREKASACGLRRDLRDTPRLGLRQRDREARVRTEASGRGSRNPRRVVLTHQRQRRRRRATMRGNRAEAVYPVIPVRPLNGEIADEVAGGRGRWGSSQAGRAGASRLLGGARRRHDASRGRARPADPRRPALERVSMDGAVDALGVNGLPGVQLRWNLHHVSACSDQDGQRILGMVRRRQREPVELLDFAADICLRVGYVLLQA